MRTQEEIVKYYQEKNEEFLSFVSVVLEYLDYENAKPFLKEDVTEEKWASFKKPLTRETVLAEIREYMSFAWEKANGERGLSANRSVDKMEHWMWLIGEQDKVNWEDYAPYGKPILRKICELYGIPNEEAH